MDAAYFLRRRTRFIRFYYEAGVEPFREIQRKIDAEEAPFDDPGPHFDPEDGEPAFLEEWLQADDAAQIVGQSAVSVLSDGLKLYFKVLEEQLDFHLDASEQKIAKENGFIAAYHAALAEVLQTDWGDCPANFEVIEQIVLARNRAQHGEHLSILGVRHDPKTLGKHRDLIFASEGELRMWMEEGADPETWIAPRLEITLGSLLRAIEETEKLAAWIEARMENAS